MFSKHQNKQNQTNCNVSINKYIDNNTSKKEKVLDIQWMSITECHVFFPILYLSNCEHQLNRTQQTAIQILDFVYYFSKNSIKKKLSHRQPLGMIIALLYIILEDMSFVINGRTPMDGKTWPCLDLINVYFLTIVIIVFLS